MFRNYLLLAFRNIIKYKSFTIINIIGLAIGMAASILMALWVFDEIQFDRFHKNYRDIYRVERDIFFEGQQIKVPLTGATYGPALKLDYPEITAFCRLYPNELSIRDIHNNAQKERIFFADSSFFKIFTFPLERGNPENALTEPNTAVISPRAAEKYFGDQDPLNKPLTVEWEGQKLTFTVTGILTSNVHHSHFTFDVILSFSTLESLMKEQLENWMSNYLYTYVLLPEGADSKELDRKFPPFVKKYLEDLFRQYLTFGDIDEFYKIYLNPVGNIYLHSTMMWEIESTGSITQIYVFSIVAVLILLIACFNFMNLSTALASRRSLEVGIRKTMGAHRRQLILQFMGETLVFSILAFFIALFLIEIVLPGFNAMTGKELSWNLFNNTSYILIILGIVTCTGLLAGIYPALFMSAIQPVMVLKGHRFSRSGRISFRQILVSVQFIISVALIIGTTTVLLQLSFMQKKPLGYDPENLLILEVQNKEVGQHLDAFRDDLKKNPMILNIAASSSIPTEAEFSDSGFETELQNDAYLSMHFSVDYDFIDTYGIEMVAGRQFSRDFTTDAKEKYIINESAVKKLLVDDPEKILGTDYNFIRMNDSLPKGKVIGVMKDFHYKALRNVIEPLTLYIDEDDIRYISIKYQEGRSREVIQKVEEVWKNHFPGIEFLPVYLEQRFEMQYSGERKMQRTLLYFTILAIFIASLGLYGLAAYTAQQKRKEIGIRKIHGATVSDIVKRLTLEFSRWVILANVIAWPLSFYFLDKWLNNFAYRISMPFWVFLAAGIMALFIAVATVSFQAIRASLSDPVEAIKYE